MSELMHLSNKYARILIKRDFQIGEEETFLYKNLNKNTWKITIRREEESFSPFKFALEGEKIGTNETFSRRYYDIKSAILHIVNCFNENENIKNRYINVEQYLNQPDEIENPRKYDYMMLDRLRSDCDYFLGNGNGFVGHLYYKDVNRHIDEMKKIYNSFTEEEKPDWISLEDIDKYQENMLKMLEKNEEEVL